MRRALCGWLALALAAAALLSGGSRPLTWVALGLAAWCLLATYAARLIGRGIRLADRGGPHPIGTHPSRGHRDAGRRLPTQRDVPAPPRERH